MTKSQFDLIVRTKYPRISDALRNACAEVILNSTTAYSAEQRNGLPRGTVSRYVNRIFAELAYCKEVSQHG